MNRVTWDNLDEYYKANNIIIQDVEIPEWGTWDWNKGLDTNESKGLTSNALIEAIRENQIKPNVKVTGYWEDEEKTILKIKMEEVEVKPLAIKFTFEPAKVFTEEELKDLTEKMKAAVDIGIG